MATASVAERVDIHKSCKAIEGLVNLLNDYCDATTATVAIQKKLAKAMREAASIRCNSEVATNALSACATVAEALVDVDSKFVKLADKECDLLSADVKKWFKVLAKEERSHDAKLAVANEKIKQAGKTYEKGVKKNPANATDEHTRYVNVLETVGTEISQEKYRHTASVFQQHTVLTLSMAVSISRIMDTEWLRACEEIRKIAPNIGQVGEWKALCEGGWSGLTPQDLPETDARQTRDVVGKVPNARMPTDDGRLKGFSPVTPQANTPAPEYASRVITPVAYSPVQPPTYFSPKETANDVVQQNAYIDEMEDKNLTINSVTSLGSFPSPPTHFPIPPVSSPKPSPHIAEQAIRPQEQQQPITPVLSESPEPSTPEPPASKLRSTSANTNFLDFTSPQVSPSSNQNGALRSQELKNTTIDNRIQEDRASGSSNSHSEKTPTSTTSSAIRTSQIYKRGDYMDNAEFGVRKTTRTDGANEEPLRAISPNIVAAERREINRSGSSVSVMREKFARTTGPASPPPKDIPRLPLSVSNLATRYEAVTETQDSRRESKGLVEDRRLIVDTRTPPGRESPVTQRNVMPSPQSPPSSYNTASSGSMDDEIARRRHRIRELEDLELREQEHELRLKEREIESRSSELERDKQRLLMARTYRRGNDSPTQAQQGFRGPTIDLGESSLPSTGLNSRHPFPTSANQAQTPLTLAPAMTQRFASSQSASSQPSSPSVNNSPSAHPDTCGCEACSITKYNTRPSVHPTVSSATPRPPADNPVTSSAPTRRGWIRRLSMPVVGNAFSSDSKKGISSANYASGGGGPFRNSLVMPDEAGRLRALAADPKNRSVTNLIGRR